MSRLPNGFGGVRKLTGKRRKPYQAIVTTGYDMVDGKAKQVQKSIGTFATRKEAMAALAEYGNNPDLFDGKTMTFSDLYNQWKKTLVARSENTKRQKQSFFNTSEILHNKPIKTITNEELQILVSSKESNATQGNYISFFRDMFRYAMAQGWATRNPAEYLLKTAQRKETIINPFSYEEYLMMPKEYDLFFYTGLRADEMLRLRKEHIRTEDNIIVVPGTKTDNSFRYVPISPKIAPIIEEKADRIWTLHTYYDKLYEDVKRLSGGNHTTHDMRKTFATALNEQKVPEQIIKKLLGHHTNDVTRNHYIKTDFTELRQAIAKLDIRVLQNVT